MMKIWIANIFDRVFSFLTERKTSRTRIPMSPKKFCKTDEIRLTQLIMIVYQYYQNETLTRSIYKEIMVPEVNE